MSKAVEVVDAIIADLSDRRGLRQAWESIDEDVRDEIRDEWVRHVKAAISDALLDQSR